MVYSIITETGDKYAKKGAWDPPNCAGTSNPNRSYRNPKTSHFTLNLYNTPRHLFSRLTSPFLNTRETHSPAHPRVPWQKIQENKSYCACSSPCGACRCVRVAPHRIPNTRRENASHWPALPGCQGAQPIIAEKGWILRNPACENRTSEFLRMKL